MVWYGADYSARELSPGELDAFHDYDIRFLIRYIGYPSNKKCISHYPGAYQAHTAAGRSVILVHEHTTTDVARGFNGGVEDAQVALADARSIGYPDSGVIFFCADRWLGDIPLATAMSYLDGAVSVLGKSRVGAYGFRDFINAARSGGRAGWFWLAGSAPSDAEAVGLHFYQWNNGRIHPGGLECDLNWSYVDPATVGGGSAGAPTIPAPAPPSAPSGHYTVQAGDSLSKIGAKLGVSWTAIAQANGIAGPGYVIHPGQDLVIPGAGVPAPAAAPQGGRTYRVKAGQSLSVIGAEVGVDWRAIAAANQIAGPSFVIFPDQVLAVPSAGAPAPAAPVARTYRVKPGDSLSKIGAQLGVPWRDIASANGVAGPKYVIQPGQELRY